VKTNKTFKNMKKTNLFMLTLVLAVSVFTGCKNKKQENISPSNSSNTANEFFANNGAKKQTFKINVDNANYTVTGDKGTSIQFPKGAFSTTNGQPVTGDIQVQLVEIYDKGNMVLSDRPTTSNGQILVSGGEIYIGATANGEQLQLNDSSSIVVTLPSNNTDPGMTLFTGGIDSSQFNWTPVPGVVPVQNVFDSTWTQDTVPYFYYDPSKYIFSISNLGWINCDRFYNAPSTTTITITCDNATSNQNTKTYLVFKSINSVSSLWDYPVGVFTSSMVPIGEQVTVIVFSFKEGKEYVATKDVTITANMHIHMNPEEATEEEITALIKQKCN
jgi:hypothetical protein